MSKETKVTQQREWTVLYVDDGASKATISLTHDEAFALGNALMHRVSQANGDKRAPSPVSDELARIREAQPKRERHLPSGGPDDRISTFTEGCVVDLGVLLDGIDHLTDAWRHIPPQYEGHWLVAYDHKRSEHFVHCNGHSIAWAEDVEVAAAICLAHNAATKATP